MARALTRMVKENVRTGEALVDAVRQHEIQLEHSQTIEGRGRANYPHKYREYGQDFPLFILPKSGRILDLNHIKLVSRRNKTARSKNAPRGNEINGKKLCPRK